MRYTYRPQLLLLILGIVLTWTSVSSQTSTSDLWGANGETWTAGGRLPDFSFAGYHSGNDPIPSVPVVANVSAYGAIGDGTTDDSDAFLAAINAANNGAVLIPPGRYRITKVLKITKSNLVLRGSGTAATTLYFPQSLRQALGPAPSWAGSSGAWSYGGGWIWFEGADNGAKLANVTSAAVRGSRTLTVSDASALRVGMIVRLVQTESTGTLGSYLHGGYFSAGAAAPREMIDWATKITAVSGNQITIERPLRVDVRLEWTPAIYSHLPTVQEVGVEELAIEFPNTAYPGHLVETGYNAFYLDTVTNCWISNVVVTDADSGALSAGPPPTKIGDGISRFCTLRGIRLNNRWRPSNTIAGHHGIAWEGPQDMLVTDFQIDKIFWHDLTVDWAATGNVFSSGRGVNTNFDHHRYVPHANLFTDIDVGTGDQLWSGSRGVDSGDASGGPPSAALETFWNIRATNAMNLPNWPQMNVIGMTKFPTQKTDRLWVEQITPAALQPANLYVAQLARRLSGQPRAPSAPTNVRVVK